MLFSYKIIATEISRIILHVWYIIHAFFAEFVQLNLTHFKNTGRNANEFSKV